MFKKYVPKIVEKSKEEKQAIIISLICMIVVLALDLITKFAVLKNFELHESRTIIPNFFSLVHVRNEGAAWGILAGKWYLLLSIAFVSLIIIVCFFRKLTEGYFERFIAFSLIVAGVLGNSFDRIYHGSVIDFLDFYIVHGERVSHWPAFNVADMGICVGVFLFMVSNLFRKEPKTRELIAETKE